MDQTGRLAQISPAAAAALSFVVLTAAQLASANTGTGATWRGYLTLLVASDKPLEEVVGALEGGLPSDTVVSALTSTVRITVFGGVQEVRVADLPGRLDPLDPRWDPYLRKLPSLFRTQTAQGPMHALYIKAVPTPAATARRVARLIGGMGTAWTLVDAAPFRWLLALLAALVFVALLGWGGHTASARRELALTAVPWLVGCLRGGLGHLLALYLVLPFVASLNRHLRVSWPGIRSLEDLRGPRTTSGVAALGASVVAAVAMTAVLGGGVMDALRVSGCVAADACLLVYWVLRDRRRIPCTQHRIFVPVAIGGRLRVPGSRRRGPRWGVRLALPGANALAMIAVVVVSPLVVGASGGDLPGSVPAPVWGGSALSWEGLEGLWLAGRDDVFPNVADYVAHEAYQTSLPWGGTYGLPTRNQELGVAHYSYRTDPAGVVADRRIVTRYSDRWLRDTLAQAGKGSVGELLVAQGRSVRVRAAQERASARSAQIWKAGIVFGIAGLALIVACLILGPTMAMGRPRPWLARRQMEA